jgi:hypothetical protein
MISPILQNPIVYHTMNAGIMERYDDDDMQKKNDGD